MPEVNQGYEYPAQAIQEIGQRKLRDNIKPELFFQRQLRNEHQRLPAPALFRATSAENPQAVNRSLLVMHAVSGERHKAKQNAVSKKRFLPSEVDRVP